MSPKEHHNAMKASLAANLAKGKVKPKPPPAETAPPEPVTPGVGLAPPKAPTFSKA